MKKKICLQFIIFSFIFLAGFFYRPTVSLAEDVKTPSILKLPAPTLQITIPGLTFDDVNCPADMSGVQTCRIPWMSQYIIALYNYGLSIAGILAAIILMAGGLLWLTSAGDNSRVSQAKELITGSVVGLVILFSSYIILYKINPSLVNLKTIDVDIFKKVVLTPEAYFEPNGGGKSAPTYCGCIKWKDLKNSNLTADSINKKLEGSRLANMGERILSLSKQYNIDAALPLAIWFMEGNYCRAGVPANFLNPGDLACTSGQSGSGWTCKKSNSGRYWRYYTNANDAVTDWFFTVSRPKSTLNSQPTIRGLMMKYAPPSDANDTQKTINVIMREIDASHNGQFKNSDGSESAKKDCSDINYVCP